jgi:L-threonylcarbamoyladenylate synthase
VKTVTSTDRAAAVDLLRKGDIVALPTETVYGLAGDALNPIAVAKIFEAKERPRFDPLIVHLPTEEWLKRVASIDYRSHTLIKNLVAQFWPGPLTIVLHRQPIIPEIVTAGLDTVAVRMSSHPIFSEVARAFGKPLAAPSANRFGHVSPTTAQHVHDELDGRIPLVIDAGPAEHGIESTIVAIHGGEIEVLRRGPVTAELLSEFGRLTTSVSAGKAAVPGQLPSHYAPKTPLHLVDNAESFSPQKKHQRVGLLAWTWSGSFPVAAGRLEKRPSTGFAAVRRLSEREDLREAAANLFRYLRELDALGLDLIVAERVPSQGLGAAIMDRLQRAAHGYPHVPDTPE